MKIPFAWMPGSWGLKGKTREIAQAEYELTGTALEQKLIEINLRDNPKLLAEKLLDFQHTQGKVSDYDYEIRKAELHAKDETAKKLAVLDIELAHGKIEQTSYDRQRADLLQDPWVSMPKINWDPAHNNHTYFELDFNSYFISYLIENGYTGTEDEILNKWLNDICQNIISDMSQPGMDFISNNS